MAKIGQKRGHRRPHWVDVIVKHQAKDRRQIMGALEDVTAKLDELEAANAARAERAAVDVAELKRLIAAGATAQDFTPVVARMDAMVQSLKGEDIDPNFPAAAQSRR